jgi:hypothetical protein
MAMTSLFGFASIVSCRSHVACGPQPDHKRMLVSREQCLVSSIMEDGRASWQSGIHAPSGSCLQRITPGHADPVLMDHNV